MKELNTKNFSFIRLNKFISNAGVCSRRKADEYIKKGIIKVNGNVITSLGTKIHENDSIICNGKLLKIKTEFIYILLNKPKGYVTTCNDEKNRPTVLDLIKNSTKERIYSVGRLDINTTGLLLLTNDGDLAKTLSHPASNTKKVYNVILDRELTLKDFKQIKQGVALNDGMFKVDDIAYVENKSNIGLEIHSGRNRIIRRLFESLGYTVMKLDRTLYGNLTKNKLTKGSWRYLSHLEIIELKNLISI